MCIHCSIIVGMHSRLSSIIVFVNRVEARYLDPFKDNITMLANLYIDYTLSLSAWQQKS